MAPGEDTGAEEFVSFYKKLKTIKDHYNTLGNELVKPFDPDETGVDLEFELQELEAMFTGEESLGRHLDLNELYQMYLNIKNVEAVSYIRYIAEYDRFKDLNKSIKSQPGYFP